MADADWRVTCARLVVEGELSEANVRDTFDLSDKDKQNIIMLARYELHCRWMQTLRRRVASCWQQRRAMKLLKSFLATEQLECLHARGFVQIVGTLGGIYRLQPSIGTIEKVVRHGKNCYSFEKYCLHDPTDEIPPADESIGHMLLLLSDESEFQSLANSFTAYYRDQLWNGDYLRRLHQARRARTLNQERRTVEAAS